MPTFTLSDDDQTCDVAEYIPRRGKLVTKPRKHRPPKSYVLSTLREDLTKCKKLSTCQCRDFFKSFGQDDDVYQSWKLNIIQQYDKFNKEDKFRYIQQWIHFKKPQRRGGQIERSNNYPRSFFFIFGDYHGYSQILCKDVFVSLFQIGQASYRNTLASVWKHRLSGNLEWNLPASSDGHEDPSWLKHFEQWFLDTIPKDMYVVDLTLSFFYL